MSDNFCGATATRGLRRLKGEKTAFTVAEGYLTAELAKGGT
jgi:hypothetical protein